MNQQSEVWYSIPGMKEHGSFSSLYKDTLITETLIPDTLIPDTMIPDTLIHKFNQGVGSYPQLGAKHVSISVCTESIKHQKESVPNINWPTTWILYGEGQNTLWPPNFFIGPPFPYATGLKVLGRAGQR